MSKSQAGHVRIAFTGKGGAGKTATAAMFARVLAREGHRVLAVDFDVNPGLDMSIGKLDGDGCLPLDAVEERDDGQYGYGLRDGLGPDEAVEAYAARGPDGLRMLSFGAIARADHGLARTHWAVRQVVAGFDTAGWDVIVDMEAGTKDVFDGSYIPSADVIVTVTNGSDIADLTCRRLTAIVRQQDGPPTAVLATRVRGDRDGSALARDLGVTLIGSVPADDAVRLADMHGRAVVDHAPDCPALAEVSRTAMRLRDICEGVRR